MSTLAYTCTCCIAWGFSGCPPKPHNPTANNQTTPTDQGHGDATNDIPASGEARYRTPVVNKIFGVRLDLNDCEGKY